MNRPSNQISGTPATIESASHAVAGGALHAACARPLTDPPNPPIRVGFGPRTMWNSFHQSGVKVAAVLAEDELFSCGFFDCDPFDPDALQAFDILIFIKEYPCLSVLQRLHAKGALLVFDVQDKRLYQSLYESRRLVRWLKQLYYLRAERRIRRELRSFDLCFAASPALAETMCRLGMKTAFLARQLYNDGNQLAPRVHSSKRDSLTLYWTGVGHNQNQNLPILPVLRRLHERHNCRIVYSSNSGGGVDFIEYRHWSRDTWEDELREVDIAFRWRDRSVKQNWKDPNKILSYMGAGLPVVMFPTESEKQVCTDQETGLMAYTPEQFEQCMVRLITQPELRAAIGAAAHRAVWSKYSLRHQVAEIKAQLLASRQAKRVLRAT